MAAGQPIPSLHPKDKPMTLNLSNLQSAALSAVAALIVSAACISAAVGPVLPVA